MLEPRDQPPARPQPLWTATSTPATTAGSAGLLSLWRARYVTLAVTSVSTAAIARYAGTGRLRGAGIATTFAGRRDSCATAQVDSRHQGRPVITGRSRDDRTRCKRGADCLELVERATALRARGKMEFDPAALVGIELSVEPLLDRAGRLNLARHH